MTLLVNCTYEMVNLTRKCLSGTSSEGTDFIVALAIVLFLIVVYNIFIKRIGGLK